MTEIRDTMDSQGNIDGEKIRSMIFNPQTPDYAFFTKEELCAAFYGCSDRTLRDYRVEGFPGPEQYPGFKAWPLSTIRAFLQRKAMLSSRLSRELLK